MNGNPIWGKVNLSFSFLFSVLPNYIKGWRQFMFYSVLGKQDILVSGMFREC